MRAHKEKMRQLSFEKSQILQQQSSITGRVTPMKPSTPQVLPP